MKNVLRLVVLVIILFACGNPAPIKQDVQEEKEEFVLSESDIFAGDKIQQFLQNDLTFTEEANRFFLKGLNAFKNDKDLDSAKTYFQRSILKTPTAKAYYELGNVLMEKRDYSNSLKAYGLAEQLGFEPYSKILYNTSCVYSLKKDNEMSAKYLEFALQAGYSNLNNINNDPDLKNLRESYYYDVALKSGLKGMSEPEKLFWLQFKRLFPKLNKPVTFDPYDAKVSTEDLEFISYDFEKYIAEMRDEKFSREVSKSFYYYGLLNENDEFVTLIYIVKDDYLGDDSPLIYRLATFDHSGKLIDKMEIAGRADLSQPLKLASVDNKMNITIESFETKYEKDPEEFGYYENKIVGKEKISIEYYKIGGNGKIFELAKKKELASN